MIQCSSCGRTLDKVPTWLAGTEVAFVCNNCPNRQAKNIAFLTLEPETSKTAAPDDGPDLDAEEDADAED